MKSNPLLYKSSSIDKGIRSTRNINHTLHFRQRTRFGWRWRIAILLTVAALNLTNGLPALATSQIDIVGPPGSGSFGSSITVLPNGNFVVTDPRYDIPGGATDVGAVYLYDGATHALISTLTGSTSDDQVSSDGVLVLSNGNYLVRSPMWDNGSVMDAGAVTWGNGVTGISDVISSSNSLVGSMNSDLLGFDSLGSSITALSNGNYVVVSSGWDNGSVTNAGAVTWGSGSTGVHGQISSSNSLVGSTSDDQVGFYGVTELSNGNYLVRSPFWHNDSATNAGAITWGNGATGISGVVSSNNSLIGSTSGDQVGYSHDGVTELTNGNYVVRSPMWDNGSAIDAGAVTWGDGSTGISGMVGSNNSVVGSTSGDQVGYVTSLSNGNYLVRSPFWHNDSAMNVGAVTWGNGSTGISGVVSSSNSLVGDKSGDHVGSGVTALSNGNYVVSSTEWGNGSTGNVGAVTWGSGTIGISGVVSSSNSLVGSTSFDWIGYGGVTALSNGNYVVSSTWWNNGSATDAGAVTWGDGTTGIIGVVSSNNSLVGSKSDDHVGEVTALSNGNYVVSSVWWDNGSATDAGAVTWGDGTTGIIGVVSSSNSLIDSTSSGNAGWYDRVTALGNGNYVVSNPGWNSRRGAVTWGNGATGVSGEVSSSNSLVGSTSFDQVGFSTDQYGRPYNSVTKLSNGNYVVRSPGWHHGNVTNAGAVTWVNGSTGISGEVSSNNSLVGSTDGDHIGYYEVTELSNSNYVVRSPDWDNGSATDAGAVSWSNGAKGASGILSLNNSVLGTVAGSGNFMNFSYNATYNQLIVGRPAENIVTLFDVSKEPIRNLQVYLPAISR